MTVTEYLSIAIGAILINNFIFSQFLGCCPFLGCSSKVETASGMGLAVVFVMGLASAICYVVNEFILVPLGLAFLKTLAHIQSLFTDQEQVPIRTALVTARNAPAHERAVKTLRAWGVHIDEAFFLGGISKKEVAEEILR